MKKFFMIAVMAVAALSANAQLEKGHVNITPYIGVGPSVMSNLSQNDGLSKNSTDLSSGSNFAVGCDFQYNCSEVFGVSAGLGFQYMQSASVEYKMSNGSEKHQYNFSCLNIPVLAHFQLGNHFSIKAGVQPGFVVGASGADNKIADDAYNKFVFSVPLGIAWKFNSPLELGIQYNLAVTKLNKEKGSLGSSDDDIKLNAALITLGWRF